MKKLLAAFILMFSADSAFAQVQAPDYKDATKLEYKECSGDFIQPEDKSLLVWHDDYVSVGETLESASRQVIVVYQPVKREVYDTEGLEEFVNISRNNP